MHFTVAVITNPDQDPEDLLAPYQENNMGDCPEEFLEFETEYTPDEFADVARSLVDDIKPDDPDKGRLLKLLGESKYKEIIIELEGLEEDKNGNLGYLSNPDSYWDWYTLGGRWSGMLKVKPHSKKTIGRHNTLDESAKMAKYHCDAALVKDIDWAGMQADKIKKAHQNYDKALKIVDKKKSKKTKEDINREVYWETGIDLNKFPTRETYIKQIESEGFYTHAFINTDGEWHDSDAWGDNRNLDYEKEFNEVIKNLKPNQLLSIYDCHI